MTVLKFITKNFLLTKKKNLILVLQLFTPLFKGLIPLVWCAPRIKWQHLHLFKMKPTCQV